MLLFPNSGNDAISNSDGFFNHVYVTISRNSWYPLVPVLNKIIDIMCRSQSKVVGLSTLLSQIDIYVFCISCKRFCFLLLRVPCHSLLIYAPYERKWFTFYLCHQNLRDFNFDCIMPSLQIPSWQMESFIYCRRLVLCSKRCSVIPKVVKVISAICFQAIAFIYCKHLYVIFWCGLKLGLLLDAGRKGEGKGRWRRRYTILSICVSSWWPKVCPRSNTFGLHFVYPRSAPITYPENNFVYMLRHFRNETNFAKLYLYIGMEKYVYVRHSQKDIKLKIS